MTSSIDVEHVWTGIYDYNLRGRDRERERASHDLVHYITWLSHLGMSRTQGGVGVLDTDLYKPSHYECYSCEHHPHHHTLQRSTQTHKYTNTQVYMYMQKYMYLEPRDSDFNAENLRHDWAATMDYIVLVNAPIPTAQLAQSHTCKLVQYRASWINFRPDCPCTGKIHGWYTYHRQCNRSNSLDICTYMYMYVAHVLTFWEGGTWQLWGRQWCQR